MDINVTQGLDDHLATQPLEGKKFKCYIHLTLFKRMNFQMIIYPTIKL